MVKRAVSVVVLTVLLLTLTGTSFAFVSTRAVGEARVSASVSLCSGKAKATGSVSILPSGYTAKVTVELQKKSGSSWIKVTGTSGGRSASVSASAKTGTTYRAYVTCKLYDGAGTCVDTITKTSGSKTY